MDRRAVQLLVSLRCYLAGLVWIDRTWPRSQFSIWYFAVSLVFHVSQIFGSLRLWLLLRRQEINFPFLPLVRLTLVGFFTNNFLPSTVGGDLYKAVALTRRGHDLRTIVLTLIVDRVLSLLTVLLMTMAATAFTDLWRLPSPGTTAYLAEAIAASAVVALLLAFSRPIMRLIRRAKFERETSDLSAKIVVLIRFTASWQNFSVDPFPLS